MLESSVPRIDPDLPLPENILRLARAEPNRRIAFIINDVASEPLAKAPSVLTEITWRHALLDIRRRAEELVAASGWPARKLGEPQFPVGLLLRHGYNYFLTLNAMIMLRWTVCVS
jgi:hypothetical protein